MKEKFKKELDAISLTKKMDANQLEVFEFMWQKYEDSQFNYSIVHKEYIKVFKQYNNLVEKLSEVKNGTKKTRN